MDIRGLRYFISAAECLNFTQAAKECFITQTAMSQHIANMEKELGFQLFRRNNRRVELTAAGRDALLGAELILGSTAQFQLTPASYSPILTFTIFSIA